MPVNNVISEPGNYLAWSEGKLRDPLEPITPIPPLAQFVHDQLQSMILQPQFPCVGARSAFTQKSYRFGMFRHDLASPQGTTLLAHALGRFIAEQSCIDGDFTTFIASFGGPTLRDEEHFDSLLWKQLQILSDDDKEDWDPTVASDPADPRFSFSFAGRAFFVVGLHSSSSRWDRRFAWPTLVFNAHYQFERLKQTGKFDRMQSVIRSRELNLQGSINVNLTSFGSDSEAKQYSGKPVTETWKCPFHKH